VDSERHQVWKRQAFVERMVSARTRSLQVGLGDVGWKKEGGSERRQSDVCL
jgi:hypothetical protein